ncbi:hypothetical protein [Halomonas elongata]|uniref:hypothetical protein n=1 Tax=Halomonas elongata TaxID=2746 RepID=UPI0023AE8F8A|nr:hypothetical protein [Halomonas elongata]
MARSTTALRFEEPGDAVSGGKASWAATGRGNSRAVEPRKATRFQHFDTRKARIRRQLAFIVDAYPFAMRVRMTKSRAFSDKNAATGNPESLAKLPTNQRDSFISPGWKIAEMLTNATLLILKTLSTQ